MNRDSSVLDEVCSVLEYRCGRRLLQCIPLLFSSSSTTCRADQSFTQSRFRAAPMLWRMGTHHRDVRPMSEWR